MNLIEKTNVNLEKPKFKEGKLKSGIVYPEIMEIKAGETVLNVGCGDGVQAIIYPVHRMVGVDIDPEQIKLANQVAKYYGLNLETIECNVEAIPLTEKFDKVIAIDIIEHVIHPDKVLSEIKRLMKPDAELLITFPAMHDKWENLFRFIGRNILRRKGKTVYKEGFDPREHQYNYSVKKWFGILNEAGLKIKEYRATTLFPPLHYLGFPRFWFSNKLIHSIDRFLCKIFKRWGQAVVCVCIIKDDKGSI